MKAAQINKYGGSEVVEINTRALEPSMSQDSILVEIHAAGINPVDWKIREGYLKDMIKLNFPATLGRDFSGLIIKINSAAHIGEFKVGDEIFGQVTRDTGAFAEFALADFERITLKPKNVSHPEAAALPIAGVSALQVLKNIMGLKKGQKILIHGGSGGIGTFAIQIAKHIGAYVSATASTENKQYIKELGADNIIDYKMQDFENLIHNYDAVLDTVGGETYKKSFKVLKKGGLIVSMIEQPDSSLIEKYGVKAISQFTQVNSSDLTILSGLVSKGIVKIQIDKIFPLEMAGEALAYLQNRHPRGKVVLVIKNN